MNIHGSNIKTEAQQAVMRFGLSGETLNGTQLQILHIIDTHQMQLCGFMELIHIHIKTAVMLHNQEQL